MNALIVEVLQLYGDAPTQNYPSTQIPSRTDLDPDCPLILADAQQLRQVLHNLLQNAQDATEATLLQSPDAATQTNDSRPVLLTTKWRKTSKRVRLSVQDQGGGFPDAILKRAFEPYVTTKAKGTGLGLAVVKKIADDHGARIDISNVVEGGFVKGAQVSLSFNISNTGAA